MSEELCKYIKDYHCSVKGSEKIYCGWTEKHAQFFPCRIRKDADVVKIADSFKGTKHDQNKLRVDLFPFTALIASADDLTYGAQKYGERNWEKGIEYSRIIGAILRHFFRWYYRIEVDTESGLRHINQAGCNMDMLQHYELTGTGIDDRPMLSEEAKERLEEMFDRWEKGEE